MDGKDVLTARAWGPLVARTDWSKIKLILLLTSAEEVVDVEIAKIHKVLIVDATVYLSSLLFQGSSFNMYPRTRPHMALRSLRG
jgi:hypothetical protein